MHIETSADARRSRRHAAGGGLVGPAADDRGYLAAAASRLSLWWRGTSRTPALTADTAPGAGLQGGTTDSDPPSNGDAAPAPLEGGEPPSQSIHTYSVCFRFYRQEGKLHRLWRVFRAAIYHPGPHT